MLKKKVISILYQYRWLREKESKKRCVDTKISIQFDSFVQFRKSECILSKAQKKNSKKKIIYEDFSLICPFDDDLEPIS